MSKAKLFLYVFFFLSYACFANTSCEYSEPNTKFIYGKTMDTIGDSLIEYSDLRCLLRDKGLKLDFKGTKLDRFGFWHDGMSGYNTLAILNRIASVPFANAYFVLAGTNDVNSEPETTVRNLIYIGVALRQKNQNAFIYISTLLPTRNNHNARNQEVNRILLSRKTNLCYNCVVVDAGATFYTLPNWEELIDAGGVHLTAEGYDAYAALVMESLDKF